jgi:hypothetical protein
VTHNGPQSGHKRKSHKYSQKEPKRVTSSEIATNKGTTKKRIYYNVEKRARNKQRVARNPQQRANRENERSERTAKRASKASEAWVFFIV